MPYACLEQSANVRMEKEVGNLQRDAKTYLDALRCKCAALVRPSYAYESNGLGTGPNRRDDLAVLLCGPSQRREPIPGWTGPVADAQGAMAGHAYKAAVDELDTGVGRDLVSGQRRSFQATC